MAVLMAAAASIPANAGDLPILRGVAVYADGWGARPKCGLYAIPQAEDNLELIYEGPNGPSIPVGHKLYTINRVMLPELEIDYPRYTIYDLDSGEELFYQNCNWPLDWSIMPADMSVDPVSGEVYAITYNRDMTGYQLSILTFSDYGISSEAVAPLSGNWNALAFDASGTLYGISKTNGTVEGQNVCVSSRLNIIDKQTGAVTAVGETGMAPEYISSATIDPQSGRMFWTVAPADGRGLLTEVDLTTGSATILRNFPRNEEIVGLYVAPKEANHTAPGRPENLTLTFEGGSLGGTLSFDMPTTLYDGSPAQGALSYSVKAEGEMLAEGTAESGAHVELNITLPHAGKYEFTVVVSNSSGDSPEARVSRFVGDGTPAGTYARLTTDGNRMILSWMGIEESCDGGYLDPSEITYDIVRYPEGTKVAEGLTQTQFSETLPMPTEFTVYKYGVMAQFHGNRSTETLSNPEAIGSIKAPYEETFDTEDSLAGWKLIDANRDLRMWLWSTLENLRISFHQANRMDDWIITPAFELEAGKRYEVSFEMCCDNPEIAEKCEVLIGEEQKPESMTTVVIEPFEIKAPFDDPEYISSEFTVGTSGRYHIGIHGISDPDSYMLNFDNFRLKIQEDSSAEAVTAEEGIIVCGKGYVALQGKGIAEVYSPEGVAMGRLAGGEKLTLPRGYYIVRQGEKGVKVIIN